jgi:hypothetical protein
MLCVCLLLAIATALVGVNAGPCCKKPREITIGVRSYDGTWWYTNDGNDEPFKVPAGMSLDDYVKTLPKGKQPRMRQLKDGKEEYYILNEGNSYVMIRDPDTNERHGYLISSDGYHAVDTAKEKSPLDEVPGVNYRTRLNYKTKPYSFDEIYEISKKLGAAQKNGFNQEYKGTHFTMDLVLALIEDAGKKELMKGSGQWPPALQMLDQHFYEKLGSSAFAHHKIPLDPVPPRATIDKPGGNACPTGEDAQNDA